MLVSFATRTRQTGRQKVHHVKEDLELHFDGPAIPFGAENCYKPTSAYNKSRLHHLAQRCFQEDSSDTL